ncbi:MAG: AAA family ATPase [Nitrospira sp.]|nr:AAA family ATPase [Nitrospira sp.]
MQDASRFPFTIPALANLNLQLTKPITFLVGENGSGKSTLIEAIADLCRLPVSGGAAADLNANHGPESRSVLAPALRPSFKRRPPDGYFFRAEFHAHFASLLEQRRRDPDFLGDPYQYYGGKSLHERSHGEAFLALIQNRLHSGLFLLDEPESALSPQRQLTLLAQIAELEATHDVQFIIATHSPILLTYPDAEILSLDDDSIRVITLQETSHYQITKRILENPASFWRHLKHRS